VTRIAPATLIVLAGVSAALHVGKLPPALPVLQQALGIGLVASGFLLSLVQFAGMTLGLLAGLAADSIGPRRVMIAGLLILSTASALGAASSGAEALLLLRACEGLGFLLATLPAPGLIRRWAAPGRLHAALGLWGAYMPIGTASAMLVGPAVISQVGWPGWWWLHAAASGVMALWLWRGLPADSPRIAEGWGGIGQRMRRTLASTGPWLGAISFAVYSGQWLALIGFLPSVYAQAGWAPAWAAAATALAAGINLVGNVASGRLLQRGLAPRVLLQAGFAGMLFGAVLAFAPYELGSPLSTASSRYAGVLVFSMLGGLVPGTLFALSVRLAPDAGSLSTTVGWMQQWSSLGQFAGPPLVAWVAARHGNWGLTWLVTGGLALAGMGLAVLIAHHLAAAPQPQVSPQRRP
jgi:CP family cyanate transporter-like MFS transporter